MEDSIINLRKKLQKIQKSLNSLKSKEEEQEEEEEEEDITPNKKSPIIKGKTVINNKKQKEKEKSSEKLITKLTYEKEDMEKRR